MRSTRSFDSCHRNRLSLLHSPPLCLIKFSGTSPSKGSTLAETVSFLLRRSRSLDQGFTQIATWREDFPHHFWRRPSWDYHFPILFQYISFSETIFELCKSDTLKVHNQFVIAAIESNDKMRTVCEPKAIRLTYKHLVE